MLPKIEPKKSTEHYPKLLTPSQEDANILKLKRIQQFLEEDHYHTRPSLPFHNKQKSISLASNQENLIKIGKVVPVSQQEGRASCKITHRVHKE